MILLAAQASEYFYLFANAPAPLRAEGSNYPRAQIPVSISGKFRRRFDPQPLRKG